MHALCSSAAIDGWPLASGKVLAVVQTVVARCIPLQSEAVAPPTSPSTVTDKSENRFEYTKHD